MHVRTYTRTRVAFTLLYSRVLHQGIRFWRDENANARYSVLRISETAYAGRHELLAETLFIAPCCFIRENQSSRVLTPEVLHHFHSRSLLLTLCFDRRKTVRRWVCSPPVLCLTKASSNCNNSMVHYNTLHHQVKVVQTDRVVGLFKDRNLVHLAHQV